MGNKTSKKERRTEVEDKIDPAPSHKIESDNNSVVQPTVVSNDSNAESVPKSKSQYVADERYKTSLLVAGYCRNYTIGFPFEMTKLCELFCFINIEDYIVDEKPSHAMLQECWNAIENTNYLLVINITRMKVNGPYSDKVINLIKSVYIAIQALCWEKMRLPNKAHACFISNIDKYRNYPLLMGYASFLKRQGRFDEAISKLNEARMMDKRSKIPHSTADLLISYSTAQCLERLGKLSLAAKQYETMKNIYENDTNRSLINMQNQRGMVYVYLAVGYMKCGMYHDSEKMYDKYLKTVDRDKIQNTITGVTDFCRHLWILQKNDEAWIYLQYIIESGKGNAFAWYYYGILLRLQGRFDEAIDAFDHSLDVINLYERCRIPLLDETESIETMRIRLGRSMLL